MLEWVQIKTREPEFRLGNCVNAPWRMEFAAKRTKSAGRGLRTGEDCECASGTLCLYRCGFQPPSIQTLARTQVRDGGFAQRHPEFSLFTRVDRYFGRHPWRDRLLKSTNAVSIEHHSYRNPLHHFGKVAGRVIGRQQSKLSARCRR